MSKKGVEKKNAFVMNGEFSGETDVKQFIAKVSAEDLERRKEKELRALEELGEPNYPISTKL